MTSNQGWHDTLDAFEARLDAQEAALAAGLEDDVAPFVPPQLDQPLPPELQRRATALVWRCRALEDVLQAELNKAQQRLDDLAAEPAAKPPAQPMYFDSRV